MSGVYIPNFKAGPLTSQTARAQSRHSTLVSYLGKRIILVHKLRKLAGTKKLFDRSCNRLGIDKILRHQAFAFCQRQALFNRTLYPHKTNPELILGHFTDTAYAPISKVIYIINDTITVADIDQALHHRHDIFRGQRAFA